MSKVNDIVEKLLRKHDCISIPNFGGFVSIVSSAHLDSEKGIIIPPRKQITFNKNLNGNDGLLISAYAKTNGLTYVEASLTINQTMEHWKSSLAMGERIILPNLGYLYLNVDGLISFEQDKYSNLLLSSYGLFTHRFVTDIVAHSSEDAKEKQDATSHLEVVSEKRAEPKQSVKPEPLEKEEEEEEEEEAVIIPINKTKKSVSKQILKWSSAAILIPFLFYSFWIPMTTDVLQSKVIYSSDFNPFKQLPSESYKSETIDNSEPIIFESDATLDELQSQLPNHVKTFSYPITDDVYVAVRRKIETVSNDSESLSTDKKSLHFTNGYHLIAGCFSELKNARDLIAKMENQGLSSFIVDEHKGLHRVSVFHNKSKKEVLKTKNELKSKGISTWVLKK